MQKTKNPVLHGIKVFAYCASIIAICSFMAVFGARDTFNRVKGCVVDDTKKSQPIKPTNGVCTNVPKTR